VFVFTAIGVSVTAYAPYAVLCWITSIIVLVFGYFNISMHKCEPAEKEKDDRH
jgi:Na+:H+ antiporter, NhaC family